MEEKVKWLYLQNLRRFRQNSKKGKNSRRKEEIVGSRKREDKENGNVSYYVGKTINMSLEM